VAEPLHAAPAAAETPGGGRPIPDSTTPGDCRPRRRRLGRPRLLIIGCGDVGLRLLALARPTCRVLATTTRTERLPALRAAGALPLRIDLDDRRSLRRLTGLAKQIVYLAPPPAAGPGDPRVGRLGAALRAGPAHPLGLVYVSTTGVYGDRGGAWVDETSPVRPGTERAMRRADAERRARAMGAVLLRAPGIYAHDRLPLERLRRGTPALLAAEDVFTNHIHADDLARTAWRALARAPRGRVYNVVDDSGLRMGEYLDCVADACGLARPPRVSRTALSAQVSPMALSFMAESRRIGNRRLTRELGPLRWPTVAAALADLAAARRSPAGP